MPMRATIRPNNVLEHFHHLFTPCCSLRVTRHASLPSQHWVYPSKHTILIPKHIYRHVCKASSLNDSAPPTVFPITGDGACLFRALAQGSHLASSSSSSSTPSSPSQHISTSTHLSKDEESTQALSLRNAICDELINRQDDIAPFIDANFPSYITAMRNPRTWGGEPELSVAPHVLKRPVLVYTISQQKELQLVAQYDGDGDYSSSNGITLLFRKFGHYDLLVFKSKEPGIQSRLLQQITVKVSAARFVHQPNMRGETMVLSELARGDGQPNTVGVIDRRSTSKECTQVFLMGVQQQLQGESNAPPLDCLTIAAVGLRCDGRRSQYNMYWFRRTNAIFAVDVRDDTYVCLME